MSHIVTTTQVQKNIGKISEGITKQSYIVTNRGEGRIVMLPYFQGCDENISEYLEDYEMDTHREELIKKYKKSEQSGKSSLISVFRF